MNCLQVSILHYVPVLSSYVHDHAALPRMSANADFSTLLKCLASGKKSIEQLRPSAPRQTSALELLEVYCFRILLVYPCALYYGMLILSRAHGACPTPPGRTHRATDARTHTKASRTVHVMWALSRDHRYYPCAD